MFDLGLAPGASLVATHAAPAVSRKHLAEMETGESCASRLMHESRSVLEQQNVLPANVVHLGAPMLLDCKCTLLCSPGELLGDLLSILPIQKVGGLHRTWRQQGQGGRPRPPTH